MNGLPFDHAREKRGHQEGTGQDRYPEGLQDIRHPFRNGVNPPIAMIARPCFKRFFMRILFHSKTKSIARRLKID
jgi:hypothetical protein